MLHAFQLLSSLRRSLPSILGELSQTLSKPDMTTGTASITSQDKKMWLDEAMGHIDVLRLSFVSHLDESSSQLEDSFISESFLPSAVPILLANFLAALLRLSCPSCPEQFRLSQSLASAEAQRSALNAHVPCLLRLRC
jgi:hypothetical protein